MIEKDFSDVIPILPDKYYIEIFVLRDPPDIHTNSIVLTRSETRAYTWGYHKWKIEGTRVNINPNRSIDVFFREKKWNLFVSYINHREYYVYWEHYPNYETLVAKLKEFKDRIRNFLVADVL